jgi:drug/metabolite transporter (DMT)-like permease
MAEIVSTPHQPPDSRQHRDREATSWVVGIVLILLGVAFLLENSGYVVLTGNWWALFIYLAAIASFANAWRSYRTQGEFGATATGSLTWGLVLTVIASIFLFNLVWDLWWPAILVAVGVGIVVGYLLGSLTRQPIDRVPD